MGRAHQREDGQGPLPPGSRPGRGGLPGGGPPSRHPARRRAGRFQGAKAGAVAARGEAMKARVHISLKPGVLDPQGKAIGNALKGLGFSDVGEVRQGKLIELEVAETDPAAARARIEEMCKQLLANPVIENYAIEIG